MPDLNLIATLLLVGVVLLSVTVSSVIGFWYYSHRRFIQKQNSSAAAAISEQPHSCSLTGVSDTTSHFVTKRQCFAGKSSQLSDAECKRLGPLISQQPFTLDALARVTERNANAAGDSLHFPAY